MLVESKRYDWFVVKGLLLAFGLIWVGILQAEPEVEEVERVSGAALIETADSLDTVLLDVVAQPLAQSEIDLFLTDADKILTWAEENGELWLSAEEAENPVALIKSFAVWEEVDLGSAEFVAVVSKLMFLEELDVEEFNLASMKQEHANMTGFLASGEVPAEALEQVQSMVNDLGRMVYLVESVVPINLPIYEKNRSQVSA